MKTKLKSTIIGLGIVLAILGPVPRAAAVPLTSNQLILDFDLTGATPAPPYVSITFSAVFSTNDPVTENVDTFLTHIYGDLGGNQLLQVRNDSAPGFSYNISFHNGGTIYGALTTANPLFNPMLDGIFSFGLSVPVGSADLLSFTVQGNTAQGGSTTVTKSFSVPDHGETWALILGGFLLLVLFTRLNPRYRWIAVQSR